MKPSVFVTATTLAALSLAAPAVARGVTGGEVARIVAAFAADAVANGRATGIGVGVAYPGFPMLTYAFGLADVAAGTPFGSETIVEIASTTKVLTATLFGEAVARGQVSLSSSLGQFSSQIGTVAPLTARVTLQELGDFTAGLPVVPPQCGRANVPGCAPNARPSLAQYAVKDLLTYLRNTVPTDYTVSPPVPLATLPGPDYYSDTSLGLLGLLLGARGAPLQDDAVDGWYQEVRTQVLAPLGMTSTYLTVPANIPPSRVAAGYGIARATATVAGGAISGIQITSVGEGFTSPPAVAILGGGGGGATATASIANGAVSAIAIDSPGQGYVAPPSVAFASGAVSAAQGVAIVADGQIAAVLLTAPGGGYRTPPGVTVSGGRLAGGRDATLLAHVANGAVTAVTVQDGGAGYLPPLAVSIAPGLPINAHVVPAWAPAGALFSTIADLTDFAAAAVGRPRIGGLTVPAVVQRGFAIAEAPYACLGKGFVFPNCGAALPSVGLAWTITPADVAHGVPQILDKAGGLDGFTNRVVLMPQIHLAVVAVVNSHGDPHEGDLAFHIAYALLYAMQGFDGPQ